MHAVGTYIHSIFGMYALAILYTLRPINLLEDNFVRDSNEFGTMSVWYSKHITSPKRV